MQTIFQMFFQTLKYGDLEIPFYKYQLTFKPTPIGYARTQQDSNPKLEDDEILSQLEDSRA